MERLPTVEKRPDIERLVQRLTFPKDAQEVRCADGQTYRSTVVMHRTYGWLTSAPCPRCGRFDNATPAGKTRMRLMR